MGIWFSGPRSLLQTRHSARLLCPSIAAAGSQLGGREGSTSEAIVRRVISQLMSREGVTQRLLESSRQSARGREGVTPEVTAQPSTWPDSFVSRHPTGTHTHTHNCRGRPPGSAERCLGASQGRHRLRADR